MKQEGILTGIITSENVELNRRRAEKLKLDVIEAGCKDKFTAIKRICKEYGVSLNNVCYIGDDINDMDAIKMVGFGCCPANALPQVKSVAKYITKANGGEGVIREVVELIMGSENI